MKIDLHIHTRTGSDGAFSIEEVFREAKGRHDTAAAQRQLGPIEA